MEDLNGKMAVLTMKKYTKTFPPGERNWYIFNNIFLVICIIPYLVTSRTKYALRQ